LIANELNVDSPLEINLSGSYNNSSREVSLDVEIIATDAITYSNLKLRIAVTENHLYYGGSYHENVFRDMTPGTSGISFAISQGDCHKPGRYFEFQS
jgi:hypothetical protein